MRDVIAKRIDVNLDGKPKKQLIERKLAEFGPLTTEDLKFTKNTKPKVAAQVEMVFTSMLSQYPTQLAAI